MQYEFSVGSFFIGLIILTLGVLFVKYYQKVADNFGGGVASYERYKLWAFIACALGVIVMLNLHAMILVWIFNMIFNR